VSLLDEEIFSVLFTSIFVIILISTLTKIIINDYSLKKDMQEHTENLDYVLSLKYEKLGDGIVNLSLLKSFTPPKNKSVEIKDLITNTSWSVGSLNEPKRISIPTNLMNGTKKHIGMITVMYDYD